MYSRFSLAKHVAPDPLFKAEVVPLLGRCDYEIEGCCAKRRCEVSNVAQLCFLGKIAGAAGPKTPALHERAAIYHTIKQPQPQQQLLYTAYQSSEIVASRNSHLRHPLGPPRIAPWHVCLDIDWARTQDTRKDTTIAVALSRLVLSS
jgi:hypothetical protein